MSLKELLEVFIDDRLLDKNKKDMSNELWTCQERSGQCLWDMSADSQFIDEFIANNIFSLLENLLQRQIDALDKDKENADNTFETDVSFRISEICFGILGNLSQDIRIAIGLSERCQFCNHLIDFLLNQWDAACLVQILRLISTSVQTTVSRGHLCWLRRLGILDNTFASKLKEGNEPERLISDCNDQLHSVKEAEGSVNNFLGLGEDKAVAICYRVVEIAFATSNQDLLRECLSYFHYLLEACPTATIPLLLRSGFGRVLAVALRQRPPGSGSTLESSFLDLENDCGDYGRDEVTIEGRDTATREEGEEGEIQQLLPLSDSMVRTVVGTITILTTERQKAMSIMSDEEEEGKGNDPSVHCMIASYLNELFREELIGAMLDWVLWNVDLEDDLVEVGEVLICISELHQIFSTYLESMLDKKTIESQRCNAIQPRFTHDAHGFESEEDNLRKIQTKNELSNTKQKPFQYCAALILRMGEFIREANLAVVTEDYGSLSRPDDEIDKQKSLHVDSPQSDVVDDAAEECLQDKERLRREKGNTDQEYGGMMDAAWFLEAKLLRTLSRHCINLLSESNACEKQLLKALQMESFKNFLQNELKLLPSSPASFKYVEVCRMESESLYNMCYPSL